MVPLSGTDTHLGIKRYFLALTHKYLLERSVLWGKKV